MAVPNERVLSLSHESCDDMHLYHKQHQEYMVVRYPESTYLFHGRVQGRPERLVVVSVSCHHSWAMLGCEVLLAGEGLLILGRSLRSGLLRGLGRLGLLLRLLLKL